MKVIVFGLGSIGLRQARVLLEIPELEVFAFRCGKNLQRNNLGIQEIFSWKEVEAIKPEVAFITNLTNLHVQTALKCADLGLHLFIEKPLSHTLKDIEKLKKLCQKKGLTCYVAYCLRFHPVIKKLKELLRGKRVLQVRVVCSSYLPDWRPNQKVENGYSAKKSAGGGVLLDLSHEFDYIRYLFGPIKQITGVFGRYGDVTFDAEDSANILIKLGRNCLVNLHLDVISHLTERSLKIDLKDRTLFADLLQGTIKSVKQGKTKSIKLKTERDQYLREQLQYFFDNIGKQRHMNNLVEAKQLLKQILRFKNG